MAKRRNSKKSHFSPILIIIVICFLALIGKIAEKTDSGTSLKRQDVLTPKAPVIEATGLTLSASFETTSIPTTIPTQKPTKQPSNTSTIKPTNTITPTLSPSNTILQKWLSSHFCRGS